MPPTRGSVASASAAHLTTAHALLLLSEYTHTLDSLPLDLSRNFADLRELDAVLSSTTALITKKTYDLIHMIESGTVSKEQRLWLLTDIAEEAVKLKLGDEDKIRVACQAADNVKAHMNHLRTLAEHIPSFDVGTLNRKTTYPHVSPYSYDTADVQGTGRRRRGAGSLLTTNHADPSPAKRKRPVRDEEADSLIKSPRKEKAPEPISRSRSNARKKTDRAASPAESLVSVTSHLPSQPPQNNSRASNANGPRTTNTNGVANKRRGGANTIRNPTPLNDFPSPHELPTTHTRREGYIPPSASHPVLPHAYPNQPGAYEEWTIPHAQQLEGPGMPVARSASIHSTIPTNVSVVQGVGTDGAATEAGDGEGDGDDKTYCFCDGVSYGEMIACDESNCEREWFHLACIGLTVPPEGRWFCETCRNKRAKRSNRGGKRRTGGNRAGGKGA